MITALAPEEFLIMQWLSIVDGLMAGRLVVLSAAVGRDLVTLRSSMCERVMKYGRATAEAEAP